MKNKFEIFIQILDNRISFYSYNNNINYLYNILATIASIQSYIDIKKIKKDNFLDFKIPKGRGDISQISFNGKKDFPYR